jgi:hypothetical protein
VPSLEEWYSVGGEGFKAVETKSGRREALETMARFAGMRKPANLEAWKAYLLMMGYPEILRGRPRIRRRRR